MTPDDVLKEVHDKFGEYIEMADDHSAITCRLLASMLIKERQSHEYSQKLLKTYEKVKQC